MLLTVVLLAWAVRGMSPTLVWHAVKSARVEWLAAGLISMMAAFSLRARRWGTLLAGSHDPGSFHVRHSAVFIGFGANCFLPANAGEIVRAAVLNQRGSVPLGAAVGSILTERLFDFLVVFLFLVVSLSARVANHTDVPALHLLPIGWLALTIVILSFAFTLAAHRPELLTHWVSRWTRAVGLGRFIPQTESTLRSLLSGVSVFRSPRRTTQALAETVVMWGLVTLAYWCWMAAFGINSLGWTAAMFAQSITALAIALPSSPGYFGPFDAGLRFALGTYSLPVNTIIAYTLSLHFLLFLSLATLGLIFLLRLGLPWSALLQEATIRPAAHSPWRGSEDTEPTKPLEQTAQAVGGGAPARPGLLHRE